MCQRSEPANVFLNLSLAELSWSEVRQQVHRHPTCRRTGRLTDLIREALRETEEMACLNLPDEECVKLAQVITAGSIQRDSSRIADTKRFGMLVSVEFPDPKGQQMTRAEGSLMPQLGIQAVEKVAGFAGDLVCRQASSLIPPRCRSHGCLPFLLGLEAPCKEEDAAVSGQRWTGACGSDCRF
jgi:hypothetical protein